MKRKYIVVALLVVSAILTVMLIVGSYVNYVPSMSSLDMQNIYLRRISRFGIAILALQIGALVTLVTNRKNDHAA